MHGAEAFGLVAVAVGIEGTVPHERCREAFPTILHIEALCHLAQGIVLAVECPLWQDGEIGTGNKSFPIALCAGGGSDIILGVREISTC